MKRFLFLSIVLVLVTGITAVALAMGKPAAGNSPQAFPDPPAEMKAAQGTTRVAVLAGGCFWGMEGVFEKLKGVQDVVSGYAGGSKETAHYRIVGTGKTGHAESVRIIYDPGVISFGTLLKVFFAVAHDPTELDYQGPDVGTQYRSAIFYTDEEQKKIAEEYIKNLDKAGVFQEPIVTQVVPLDEFYPAEEYHQDFMKNNPDYPYIVYWDLPKIEHLLKAFPELVAKS